MSLLNLRLVGVEYRPIVGSLAGAVWNIYVSAQANKKTVTQTVTEEYIVEEMRTNQPNDNESLSSSSSSSSVR